MEAKKRVGRPKGPAKEIWKRYVTPEQKVRLEKAFLGGSEPLGACGVVPEGQKAVEGQGTSVMVHVGRDEVLTKYKEDNRALLDEVGQMEDLLRAKDHELEEMRTWGGEEWAPFWRARCMKAEQHAARIENSQ